MKHTSNEPKRETVCIDAHAAITPTDDPSRPFPSHVGAWQRENLPDPDREPAYFTSTPEWKRPRLPVKPVRFDATQFGEGHDL